MDVAWYDARNDPTVATEPAPGANAFHDVYYTYSLDQGRTFAPNIRVSDRGIDRRIGPTAVGDVQGKVGIASIDRGVYIAWDDTRNGSTQNHAQDIYFARGRLDEPGDFFAGGDQAMNPLVAGTLGLAVGLSLAGILLFLGLRRAGAAAAPAEQHPA